MLKGKLRSWAPYLLGLQPLYFSLSSQKLSCAYWPGLGHSPYQVTVETPGPDACKSDPRILGQWEHSELCLFYSGTIDQDSRLYGFREHQTSHCHKGVPCQ